VAELPTGTVTFLFTDLESSTRLWEQQPEAMSAALARHDQLLTEAVEARGGTRIKGTGDGLHAVFPSAEAAVMAAVDAQRALGAEEWGPTGSLRVRMGLHTGVAEERDGDYFGPVLNRAARLMSAGHGGQVLCSQATADLVRDSLPGPISLVDLGSHRLRDLARPEFLFQVTTPDLPAEFPPLLSLESYPTNLPAERTVLIGREDLLGEISEALGEVRVVTLTGVGGVGKTRLALQVAADLLPRYRDGAWLVELAPVVDPGAVVQVVAATLGVTQRTGQTLDASLVDYLRAKQLLLVLDNCEHLLDPAATFIDEVIDVCTKVVFVVTSREGLGVAGERIIAVPSLALPHENEGDVEILAGTEAVRLFVERARDTKSGFRLSDANQGAVVHLCRRLDGIPLAIELAAARVRSLSPAELAERLDTRFRLLAGGPRTAVERHQTLRRAIDWSYDLLAEEERQIFRRLAVFAGGFLIGAAEQVINDEGLDAADVLDPLARLVDKSLLVAEDQDGVTRYQLLETIRQYAQDRLESSDEADLYHRRHAEYYATFATEATQGMLGTDELSWTLRLEAELDNLRSALAWALAAADADLALRLVAPLAHVHTTRVGYAAAPWVEPVLALDEAPSHSLYLEVLAWSGWVAVSTGQVDRAVRSIHEALEGAAAKPISDRSMCRLLRSATGTLALAGLYDESGEVANRYLTLARSLHDEAETASALTGAATPFLFTGDVEAALAFLDEALAIARRLGNPSTLSQAALVGGIVRVASEPERAGELLDEALAAARSVGNPQSAGMAIGWRAFFPLEQGDWREAARRLLRAMEHNYHVGDSLTFRNMAGGLVPVFVMAGDDELAAVFSGAPGDVVPPGSLPFEVKVHEAEATLRQRLGEAHFAACASRGRGMDDDDLVALAQREVTRLLAAPGANSVSVVSSARPAAGDYRRGVHGAG